MEKLITALSFRTLLTLPSTVLMIATLVFGGSIGWTIFTDYGDLKSATKLEHVAVAAGEILLATGVEGSAVPQNLAGARQRLNGAHDNFVSAFADVAASGFDDPLVSKYRLALEKAYSDLTEYRALIDGGSTDPMVSLKYLWPLSAPAIEITGRSGNIISEPELAALVKGLYALEKVHVGYLVINRFGQRFTREGKIGMKDYALLSRTLADIDTFTLSMRELLPGNVIEEYDSYWKTADGVLVRSVIDSMAENRTYEPSQGDAAAWSAAINKRREAASALLLQLMQRVEVLAETKSEAARTSLIIALTVLVSVISCAALLSLITARALSRAIHQISERMRGLVNGDKETPIPFVAKSDEIGTMANSVEVFRNAAIDNDRLQMEAEASRSQQDADRLELQRQAEANAAQRLRTATAGFAAGLTKLAAGDLSVRLTEEFSPEFEALRHDFNQSIERLAATLKQISSAIVVIDNSSREIAVGANDLSRRTEQQAASLEETAAALDQITSNVSSSTMRTEEARKVATLANQSAIKSGEVVGHAEEAMRNIEASSQQISNIIGVIDEIAFQTNLLALNAGVEAARAGDAGKGFAVVAQEVRELAQRSAKAAKEIKSLIQNSSSQVSTGVHLVKDASGALKTIGDFITQINVHMNTISVAAREQTIGLSEVNIAVNSMDQVTQQNAAMVEQTTAAATTLADEAERLRSLVDQFNLGVEARRETAAMRRVA